MTDQPSHGKRILAWSGIVFGLIVAALSGTILVLEGRLFPTLGMLAFALALVVDRAMYLRGVFTARKEWPTWNRVWSATNLFMMGSMTLSLFFQNKVYRTALLAEAGALALTIGMLFLALLMSGASWRGEPGPRQS
jgi:hypothetical protein